MKIAFHETAQEYFLSSKFDNVLSTLFAYRLDGKLALFHNLLKYHCPTQALNSIDKVLH